MSTRSHIHRLLLLLSIVAALPLAATAASSASHRPPCAGEEATIVGTAGDGTLLSTLILGAVFLTESPEFLIGYEQAERYLAAVDAFRPAGYPPRWLPEHGSHPEATTAPVVTPRGVAVPLAAFVTIRSAFRFV